MTRRATAARADTSLATRVGDAWGNLVSVVIGVAVLAGAVSSLRERISLAGPPLTPPVLPAGTAAVFGAALLGAGVLVCLDRLGPVSSTPAAAAWWLPLPAGRPARPVAR